MTYLQSESIGFMKHFILGKTYGKLKKNREELELLFLTEAAITLRLGKCPYICPKIYFLIYAKNMSLFNSLIMDHQYLANFFGNLG